MKVWQTPLSEHMRAKSEVGQLSLGTTCRLTHEFLRQILFKPHFVPSCTIPMWGMSIIAGPCTVLWGEKIDTKWYGLYKNKKTTVRSKLALCWFEKIRNQPTYLHSYLILLALTCVAENPLSEPYLGDVLPPSQWSKPHKMSLEIQDGALLKTLVSTVDAEVFVLRSYNIIKMCLR